YRGSFRPGTDKREYVADQHAPLPQLRRWQLLHANLAGLLVLDNLKQWGVLENASSESVSSGRTSGTRPRSSVKSRPDTHCPQACFSRRSGRRTALTIK